MEDGKVKLEKVDTLENVAYALTKPVSTVKFRWCASSMGLSAPFFSKLCCALEVPV